MLLIEEFAAGNGAATEKLELPFESRCKSRLRVRLASGEECGLFLPRGTVMRGGDKLLAGDGRIAEVVAAIDRVNQIIGEISRASAEHKSAVGSRPSLHAWTGNSSKRSATWASTSSTAVGTTRRTSAVF